MSVTVTQIPTDSNAKQEHQHMDIYKILASKPHNPHYLNRYIRFIEWCQLANKNITRKSKKNPDGIYIYGIASYMS